MLSVLADIHLGVQSSQENFQSFCNRVQIRWLLAFQLRGDRPGTVNISLSLKLGKQQRSVAGRARGIRMSLAQCCSYGFMFCWRLYLVTRDCLCLRFPANNFLTQSNCSRIDGHCYQLLNSEMEIMIIHQMEMKPMYPTGRNGEN